MAGALAAVSSLRVLIVEDLEDDAALVVHELRRAGWDVVAERVETAEGMAAALAAPWDVVVADYALPRFSGPAALAMLRGRQLDLPFIIVSGAIGEETAVAAMRAGANDYVGKGHLTRLGPVIQRELREAEDRRQRRAAEEALAREREYSRSLVEGANALIVGLDTEGRITVFNPAAEAVTGYRLVDLRGRNWFEILAPRGRYPEAWEAFLALRAGGGPADVEGRILTATGEERVIAWRNSVLRAGAAVVGTISFGLDVTDRRRAEEERAALEQAARRAEKLAALGTLAAGLAHELNNPIGIISSRIEVMLMEGEATGLPDVVREDLKVLHRNAHRVARIAQGLLSFARPSPAEWRPVQLNDVVSETLLLAERQVTQDGIRVTVRLEESLPPVLGDQSALQQVLLNLFTNARDAVEAGGEIRIHTRRARRPGRVELTVSDTGIGIAPEAIAKIFDPFFSTKPQGTGLGLSITHGIVREHGGTIDVESTPGKGTRFRLTFPVTGAGRS